jgi:hypothetical protein
MSAPEPRNTSEGHRDYLLAELRCAAARARLAVLDIEAVGLALKYNIIGPVTAVRLLTEADVLGFIGPQQEDSP